MKKQEDRNKMKMIIVEEGREMKKSPTVREREKTDMTHTDRIKKAIQTDVEKEEAVRKCKKRGKEALPRPRSKKKMKCVFFIYFYDF